MSDANRKTIHELLNEEKWTRATINSYTVNNFKELDSLITATVTDETQNEIKQLCDEHLTHTKNSIIALYISGIIALRRQIVDDTHLVHLISIFMDNHKWKIVEFLCNRILSLGENKTALRTLAECYSNENEEEKMYAIWERLIHVDYEETEIVRLLAEKKEREGDTETAVDYYKKAIHRFLNKKLFAHVKEIWQKLIEYCPDDLDFFYHVERKTASLLNGERASTLLEELYKYYRSKEDWDNSIEILKRILSYDPKNQQARKEITDCYRQKYSYHSQLEEYIKISNLTQGWRSVHEAIADFEKHISFDEGNFVFHRSWGIGRISSIKDDEIIIDFVKKRNHAMSLKMAVGALQSLSKEHIWVLKCIWKKEKLRERVKQDIPWALRTVIRSFENGASMKQIKDELVPSILEQSEWNSWSTEARKILKTNPVFGNIPDKVDQFVVRDKPISFEEKVFNQFKAAKSFFGKIKALEDFLEHSDSESEYFSEMFGYFVNFLKAFSVVNEVVVSSYFLVKHVVERNHFLNPGIHIEFRDLFDQIEDIQAVFRAIEDQNIKRDFLGAIKNTCEDWPDYFLAFFSSYPNRYIIDELEANGFEDRIRVLFQDIIDGYRDNREAFIWLARNSSDTNFFQKYGLKYEKTMIGMIHLLGITFREINNKRDVSENRKLNKQIQSYLFKDQRLDAFVKESDEDSIGRIYTLVKEVKELDPSIRIELKHKIVERFPDFKFYGEDEQETVSRGGLIVTAKSYEAKQKMLQHILDVEIPANSKEIGAALELGDLRENAEYKAAKEKQELLNTSSSRLKEELERARIFSADQVDVSKISFGTVAVLRNETTGKNEEYTILGPWESDPSNNILSYLSPFAAELLNHKTGDSFSFSINERSYAFSVIEIREASF